jgi:hypothetical protein
VGEGWADEEGLEDAVLTDVFGEASERAGARRNARAIGIRHEVMDGNGDEVGE